MPEAPGRQVENTPNKPTDREIIVEYLRLIFKETGREREFDESKLSNDINVLRKPVVDFLLDLHPSKDSIRRRVVQQFALKYPNLNDKDFENALSPPVSKEEVNAGIERRERIRESYDKMTLDQLIANHPDKKQSAQWEKIKNLEWPQPKGKVKLVIIGGGTGLDKDVEKAVKETKQNLRSIYKDKLEIVRVPYPLGSVAKDALQKFKQIVNQNDGSDIIIPYIVAHGSTHPTTDHWVAHEHSTRRRDLSTGLSSEDFRAVVTRNKNKQFLFILITCFSGSATDDPLSNEKNVFGIIAATDKNQLDMTDMFDNFFNKYLGKGMQLGEAFIRADAAASVVGTKLLNPRAVFNINNQRLDID